MTSAELKVLRCRAAEERARYLGGLFRALMDAFIAAIRRAQPERLRTERP